MIELFKLKSGKYGLDKVDVLFFQFLNIRCALNKSETWEKELPKKFPELHSPRLP